MQCSLIRTPNYQMRFFSLVRVTRSFYFYLPIYTYPILYKHCFIIYFHFRYSLIYYFISFVVFRYIFDLLFCVFYFNFD